MLELSFRTSVTPDWRVHPSVRGIVRVSWRDASALAIGLGSPCPLLPVGNPNGTTGTTSPRDRPGFSSLDSRRAPRQCADVGCLEGMGLDSGCGGRSRSLGAR